MDIKLLLGKLDEYLKTKGETREITICGGAALIFQGFTNRETQDIDVILPRLDEVLRAGAKEIGEQCGFHEFWLNSGPVSFSKKLKSGWEARRVEVFRGSHLLVFSVSRLDLIFLKFFALCDRQEDLSDLVCLKPTPQEITEAIEQARSIENSDAWKDLVNFHEAQIKKELGYE